MDTRHLETDIERQKAALHDREMASAHLEITKLKQEYSKELKEAKLLFSIVYLMHLYIEV